jgi:predicted acetyltransferase
MRSEWIRRFIHLGRRGETMLEDESVALRPREYGGRSRVIGSEHTFTFDVVERASGRIAGEISLRVGDSPEQFYLGHVGYHVDPPFRGHGYAARACRLCAPMLAALGMRTAVITTDPGNLPSVKTCQRLGCVLECTVPVPGKVRDKLSISLEKRRYIWFLEEDGAERA